MTTKAPRVIERTSYEEQGTGPMDDSDAYSIELPEPRGRFMPKRTSKRRTAPILDRRTLRRSDGGGGSAERPKKLKFMLFYPATAAVALLFLGLAAGLKYKLESNLYQDPPVEVQKEPPPDSIGGVKVRRGVGTQSTPDR